MTAILSAAILLLYACTVWVLIGWGKTSCRGKTPVGVFTFMAILFTSGLDMGLVILPLTEFPTYLKDPSYSFANPLAIEFGFWGFLIWIFYYLSTFYFCVLEPRVRFFENPLVKFVNNAVIVGTCAFTVYLFAENLKWYFPSVGSKGTYLLILLVIFVAVNSSLDLKFVKILSTSSTALFFGMIAGLFIYTGCSMGELAVSAENLESYFLNIHHFVLPLNDYHAFYLFWWFSWSIMIGQFVSQFAGGLSARSLFLAFLILPSLPLAIWFSVLFLVFEKQIELPFFWRVQFLVIGILFVINSVDSLVRLYSDNLDLSVRRLGSRGRYVFFHSGFLLVLVMLFSFTPLRIEWVGLLVIGIFFAAFLRVLQVSFQSR